MKRAGGVSLVEIMHEATGVPRRQLRRIVSTAVRHRCRLHTLEQVHFDGRLVWQCNTCKWRPTRLQLDAYEQGLYHGRTHRFGGGRGK